MSFWNELNATGIEINLNLNGLRCNKALFHLRYKTKNVERENNFSAKLIPRKDTN